MVAEADRVLTVNAGSSSLKLHVLDAEDGVIAVREADRVDDPEAAREELAAILAECGGIDAAGHRIVHGGSTFTAPTVVDSDVERELDSLADLAPLHNPPAVDAMRELDALLPGLPTVACFDTSFHAGIPAAASTYAIPAAWSERWPLRRFGFHGLSHAYASRRAAELLGRPVERLRLVTAHLGAGASLAAVRSGRSVDTTMGFTPLEGLVMATRSGSVDPGLLLWVQRHGGIGPEQMEAALDRESGLLGLSGRSADMREVIAGKEAGDERCALAFDVYVHRLTAGIAAMAASMGGLDGVAFTGGVGENSVPVREAACDGVSFLGLALDRELNRSASGDRVISAQGAAVPAVVVRAREEIEIAAQLRAALAAA